MMARWPLAFAGSMTTSPSSWRYTAPSFAAATHGASSQCPQTSGVYDTRTTGTLPRTFSSTLHQKCPVIGWSAA